MLYLKLCDSVIVGFSVFFIGSSIVTCQAYSELSRKLNFKLGLGAGTKGNG